MSNPPTNPSLDEILQNLQQFQPYVADIASIFTGPSTLQSSPPQGQNFTFPRLRPKPNRIPIDLISEEKSIYILAELPGVLPDDVSIDIFNNKITILAKKNRESISGTQNVSELQFGQFERVVNINFCITRPETIRSSMKNGILKIKIDKLVEEKNKFSVKPVEEKEDGRVENGV